MKEWRDYSTDENERWEILIDVTAEDDSDHLLSKDGNEAVMLMKRLPGDIVSISLISASREFDSVTGRIGNEKYYYLKIESLKDDWYCISSRAYLSNEVIGLASMFMDKPSESAKKLWKIKKLGNEYTYRGEYLRNDKN